MRRYLSTGGAGFIGSHLADSLIAEGQAVRVIDNLFSGRMENLPAGAELVQGDVICQHVVRSALEGVDGCFHLAAIASVEFCHEGWLRGHVVNLGGAITIFEEVRRAQRLCGRYIPIVYASSAAVYGNAMKLPLSEASPTAPANAYGVDKLACELHAAVGSRLHDLSIVGLRFFNIYGPRQDPKSPYSGAVSIFCRKILDGEQIEIHGDGAQIRDFVYVDDAVMALRRAMSVARPRAAGVFNVCTGRGTKIRELAETVARLRDVSFAPRYAPAREADVRVSVGDPRSARDELGFVARVALGHGLALTLASMEPNDEKRKDEGHRLP
jgi:UDP-glucose 4-epimerase